MTSPALAAAGARSVPGAAEADVEGASVVHLGGYDGWSTKTTDAPALSVMR